MQSKIPGMHSLRQKLDSTANSQTATESNYRQTEQETRSSLIAPNKASPSRQDEPSSSPPADPHSVVGVRQCAVVLLATAKLGTHTNVYVGKERKETGSSQRLAPAIRVSDEVIKPCAHIINDGLFCTHVHGKALQFQR